MIPIATVGRVSKQSAEDDLVAASSRADVEVRTLTDLSDLEDARSVFDSVWPSGAGATQIQPNLMKAIVHAGGYASAAYRRGTPIGAAFGFLGRHDELGHPAPHLHSHMAAVLDPYRDQHVGSALKMHQRVWCLDAGLDTIVWTFDPLVRRNAIVNLLKLGVDVEGFEVDFYGSMDDAINAQDPTDRLFAWWRLASVRAEAASRGRLHRLNAAELIENGRDIIEVELPADIVSLRKSDPVVAAQWRVAVREALVAAFAAGFAIVGVSVAGGYVLERTS